MERNVYPGATASSGARHALCNGRAMVKMACLPAGATEQAVGHLHVAHSLKVHSPAMRSIELSVLR
jgi:hypothetical protein